MARRLFAVLTILFTALAAIAAQAQSSDRPLPFFRMETPEPVTPEAADAYFTALQNAAPGAALRAPAAAASASTSSTAPEIAELARALRNDIDLIFQYVYNEIAVTPTFGLKKSALGTLLDKDGNPFDQANLLLELVREAGYDADLVYGRLQLPAAQANSWLATTGDGMNAGDVLNAGHIPYIVDQLDPANPGTYIVEFNHVWVQVDIGGTLFQFDPSLKTHAVEDGYANLHSVMGYTAIGSCGADPLAASCGLLDAAGGTQSGNLLSGFDNGLITQKLDRYAENLVSHIQGNDPAADLSDIVGGWTVSPELDTAVRNTAHPYLTPGSTPVTWTTTPNEYRTKLRLSNGGDCWTSGIRLFSDSIDAKRLTIKAVSADRAALRIDGDRRVIYTGLSGKLPLEACVDHPFPNSNGVPDPTPNGVGDKKYSLPLKIETDAAYAIMNGWGKTGRDRISYHQKRLEQAKFDGLTSADEAVIGETLAVTAANWLAQTTKSNGLLQGLFTTWHLTFNQIGIAGQLDAPYVDIPGGFGNAVSRDGNTSVNSLMRLYANTGIGSAFESTTIAQLTDFPGISTVSLFDNAASQSFGFYDFANASEVTAAIETTLLNNGYSEQAIQTLKDALASPGSTNRAIVPDHGDLSIGQWTGFTYLIERDYGGGAVGLGYVISGGFNGGFSGTPLDATEASQNATGIAKTWNFLTNSARKVGRGIADPVNTFSGSYYSTSDDITVGTRPFPHGLTFSRSYNSNERLDDVSFGLGWKHGFDLGLSEYSDGFYGMGERSPIDGAGMIVTLAVATDLINLQTSAKNIIVATLVQDWGTKQLFDNAVTVRIPQNNLTFMKLPGTQGYNPPPDSSAQLTENGGFVFETLAGDQLLFDGQNNASEWIDPNGFSVDFVYDANNRLTKVTNDFGWELNLTYNAAGLIGGVDDGNGRSVAYTYDASNNLLSYQNAEGDSTVFTYEAARPGLLTEIFYPSFPADAFITNTYDTLGRVQQQTNSQTGLANTYEYFLAGSRVEMVDPLGNNQIWYQDEFGKITRSIDALGRETASVFDGRQRLVETTYPEGNRQEITYDDASCVSRCTHNIASVTQVPDAGRGGGTIADSFTYWGAAKRYKLSEHTDPRLNVSSFDYDAAGNLLTATGAAVAAGTPVTTFEYFAAGDARDGLMKAVTDPTGLRTSHDIRASDGALMSVTVDPNGLALSTAFTYDAWGNQNTVTDPEGRITTQIFDCERRLRASIPPAPGGGATPLPTTRSDYDADGRVVATNLVSGAVTGTQCNGSGGTGTVLQSWTNTYYVNGFLKEEIDPESNATTYVYDMLERLVSVEDADGRKLETAYDAAGQVTQTTASLGAAQQDIGSFEYNLNGYQTAVTDGEQNRTEFSYDGHDRLVETRFPDPDTQNAVNPNDTELVQYDAAGNAVSTTNRAGQGISYVYDALNRLTNKLGAVDQDVVYAYDLAGRQTSVGFSSGPAHDISYSYDTAARLVQVTDAGRSVGYSYDKSGLRTELIWPDAVTVSYRYDAAGRLASLNQGAAANPTAPVLASFAYDTLGRMSTQSMGAGPAFTVSYAYFPDDTLDTQSGDLPGTADDLLFDLSYSPGNLITARDISLPAYAYEPPFDLLQSYTANGLNQITSVLYEGGFRFNLDYDGNGNLSGDGAYWSYGFDAENRMVSAAGRSTEVAFGYDPLGRRASKTVTGGDDLRYLYDGGEVIADTDASGTILRRYVYGLGVDQPMVLYAGSGTAAPQFYMTDPLGSVVALTDAAGTVLERHSYSAFGIPADPAASASGNPLRFAARTWDAEIGLYDYRARVYSPTLGRFMQPDPIGYGDGFNLYAYAGNNPVNFVDPSGMAAEAARQKAGDAVISTANFIERNEREVAIGIGVAGIIFDVVTLPSGEGAAAVAAAPLAARGLAKLAKSAGSKLKGGPASTSSKVFGNLGTTIKGGRKISDTISGSNKVMNSAGDVFKRVDFPPSRPHSGLSPHTHPNYRNVLPDGSVRTGVSRSANPVSRKDIIDASRPNSQRVGPQ